MPKRTGILQICLLLAVFVLAAELYGQARIGGRGGGGVRGGGGGFGVGAGRSGGGPMRLGAPSRARGFEDARPAGLGARGLSDSSNTAHPRGYIGAPGEAGSRVRNLSAAGPGRGPGAPGPARGLTGSRIPGASVGAPRGSTVILEPGSSSIPPLGPSIPPLERPGTVRPGGIRGDFDRRGEIFDFDFDRDGFFRRGGLRHRFPVVVVPFAYRGFGDYYEDREVIVIDSGARTESSAEYAVAREPQTPAEPPPPVTPKVIEVQPLQPGQQGQPSPQGETAGQQQQGEQQQERPVLYLIAFKSGEIHAAKEQWLEGQTLHYITAQGARKQAPLDQLDMNFSAQLNEERGLDFVLEVRRQGRQDD